MNRTEQQMKEKDLEDSKSNIANLIGSCSKESLSEVQKLLQYEPTDPDLLLLASLAALFEERPEQCLRYLNRLYKRYVPTEESHLLRALALAQQGHWFQAGQVIKQHNLSDILRSHYRVHFLPLTKKLALWINGWLDRIKAEVVKDEVARLKSSRKPAARLQKKPINDRAGTASEKVGRSLQADEVPPPLAPALPSLQAHIPIKFSLPKAEEMTISQESGIEDGVWFGLRLDFAHLNLLQGFDELLCLPLLHNVETYWYQVETVRKVLKQFRGRVLLADEVGLGKTIEAGMVLKEYLLRGMAKRVLVLTPAGLVGQWMEEMESKFDIKFASSYDNLLRSDPEAFWTQPMVIASIATARRAEHLEILARQSYDLVIVDEAHHLKNRSTSNWKLIDALRKRFLLLLSATPVQNSLVELYNLLTLLKPGIFKTEKEFRANYMIANQPRIPANRERMRDLMRDVMIRNTRALVDLKLPLRQAITLRLEADAEEGACYQELSRLTQEVHREGYGHHRMALRHLLTAAGSSPAAAASAIHRFAVANKAGRRWLDLNERYQAISRSIKETALLDLLRRNPDEKKMVFVHHRETLDRLDSILQAENMRFVRFEGSMSGPEKDSSIESFRKETPLLLCTESGGEGRNLQFCNTLINFDLAWNPMAIEQRIGRLHRIGQTRRVFIFNMAVSNTIEEHILRILDEKINMFELVVGEIGSILGEMDENQEFTEMIFTAWLEATEQERPSAFESLGERLADAKRQYEKIKALDEELFGDEFEAV
jgi:superfamily II DNA or RNA helicase